MMLRMIKENIDFGIEIILEENSSNTGYDANISIYEHKRIYGHSDYYHDGWFSTLSEAKNYYLNAGYMVA